MKAIKRVIILLVCFVLLSNCLYANAAGYNITHDIVYDFFTPSLDPYSVSLMDVGYYEWLPIDSFGFSDSFILSDKFLFFEDLPYGLDTVIVGIYFNTAKAFIFMNGKDEGQLFQQNWSSNGKCTAYFLSDYPIYRILYNSDGSLGTFNGAQGLSCSNNQKQTIEGVTIYGYQYTFSTDCYCVVASQTASDLYVEVYMGNTPLDQEPAYGVSPYPVRSEYDFELQKEEVNTSKGIWETLKSIPSQIGEFFDSLKNYLLYFQSTEPEHVNPFSNLLSDVQSFFTDVMSSTDGFKSSLENTASNVTSYINQGSNIIERLLNGVPILNTVLIFLFAFAVVRKVVGR